MPGPTTEVLNEDIKELKGDIRDVRSSLDVLKAETRRIDVGLAELRADLRRSNLDGLKADVQRTDIGLAELRAEFRFAKWLLGLLLVTTLTGVGGGIWWASKIDTKVNGLDARFDRLESKFDRLEGSMSKIIEQTRPAPAPLPIPQPTPPKP